MGSHRAHCQPASMHRQGSQCGHDGFADPIAPATACAWAGAGQIGGDLGHHAPLAAVSANGSAASSADPAAGATGWRRWHQHRGGSGRAAPAAATAAAPATSALSRVQAGLAAVFQFASDTWGGGECRKRAHPADSSCANGQFHANIQSECTGVLAHGPRQAPVLTALRR